MPNKIKNVKTLAESKFLNMYDVEYTNKLKNTKRWTVASRRSPVAFERNLLKRDVQKQSDAVIIAPYHVDEKKFVLIKQFRVPINDYVYELPAGLIETDEEMVECVKRELKEETGLKLLEIHLDNTFRHIYASAGMTDETMDIVYCTCSGTVSLEHLEEDEDIEVVMVDADEAKALILSRPVIDVKALLVLQHYALGGFAIFTNKTFSINEK